VKIRPRRLALQAPVMSFDKIKAARRGREKAGLQPIARDIAHRFFKLRFVDFQNFFYFKCSIAGPAVGPDAASSSGQPQGLCIAGRAKKQEWELQLIRRHTQILLMEDSSTVYKNRKPGKPV
jgi:hypothetical protein